VGEEDGGSEKSPEPVDLAVAADRLSGEDAAMEAAADGESLGESKKDSEHEKARRDALDLDIPAAHGGSRSSAMRCTRPYRASTALPGDG
jgi:hypothetical protein